MGKNFKVRYVKALTGELKEKNEQGYEVAVLITRLNELLEYRNQLVGTGTPDENGTMCTFETVENDASFEEELGVIRKRLEELNFKVA